MTIIEATDQNADINGPADTPGAFLRMTVVGVLVAVVLGWTLLSFAISLPFFLGVFFFMLFGLFVGAAMFRAARNLQPIKKKTVVTATVVTVFLGWMTAVVKEGADYPKDFVKQALKKAHVPPTAGAHDKVQSELKEFILRYLTERFPPGGVLGYLRLAATGQTVTIDNLPTKQPRPIVIKPRTGATTWWVRNLLCIVMYFVAIYSITADLQKGESIST